MIIESVNTNVVGILLAAGSSLRMGHDKLLTPILDKAPLELSLSALANAGVDEIIVTVSEQNYAAYKSFVETNIVPSCPVRFILGGETRADSVFNALSAISADIAVIHDAARCLVTPEIIISSVVLAQESGSAIAMSPARDTIRSVKTHERIVREEYAIIQTPQTFRFEDILAAYKSAKQSGTLQSTQDDCAVYAMAGYTPSYFDAGITNQKLTYSSDIPYFKAMLREQERKTEI